MNPFRRTPPRQSPPAPAAPQGAPPSAPDDMDDLQQVMDTLLDDVVVSQRVPPNVHAQPPAGAPPSAQQPAAPGAPTTPAAPPSPAAPAPPAGPAPSTNPNVGPQLLPQPDPSWSRPAPGVQQNGPQRPPMPPAPVGVSTVPPVAPAAGGPPPAAHPEAPASGAPASGAPVSGTARAGHALRAPGDPFALPEGMDPNAVVIRGRGEGVAVEIGPGAWADVLNLLSYRLEQAGVALRSTRIELELGNRALTEPDLDALRTIMAGYGMEPALVRSSSERTFMAALALGMATQQTTVDGVPVSEAQRGVSVESQLGYFIFRGSLRSGQQLHRNEHVLIIGDVNPGAEVVSSGDILVWGRLRGIAHAGARGNSGAVIAALDLDPVQLRIDRVIGAAQAGMAQSGPRWGGNRSAARRPELARLVAGQLTVQEWDDTRLGGSTLKRRRG